MELYEKIKSFVGIKPISMNIGEYLKDATKVHKIYYEMIGLEAENDDDEIRKKENELDEMMMSILNKWKESI